MKKTTLLKNAILERRAVVIPGCHDALSARVIASTGFEAVVVSGFGLSGSLLGQPDVGLIDMKETVEAAGRIAGAVDVPVMVDADTGGGNALNVVQTAERLVAAGAASMIIEDQVFPKRCGHLEGKQIISAEEMIGKVRACASVRDQYDPDFVITARTDALTPLGLGKAVDRCNAYLSAGADITFIDGIQTRQQIEQAAEQVEGPFAVNLMDAVTGVRTELVPIPDLAEMGIGIAFVAVASVLVLHKALGDFYRALRESPNGLLEGQPDRMSSFESYLKFIGFDKYQELEQRFLSPEALQQKYERNQE